jgi:hypothetical protein
VALDYGLKSHMPARKRPQTAQLTPSHPLCCMLHFRPATTQGTYTSYISHSLAEALSRHA